MTRQKKGAIAILISLAASLFLYLFLEEKKVITGLPITGKSQTSSSITKAVSPAPETSPAAFLANRNQEASKAPKEPVWKKSLEKTLFTQARGTLKKVEIKIVDSFPWKIGQVEIIVDSIEVKIEGSKGQRSSFRAIVDAANGKILQTWDRPIIDNFDSRSELSIKIDPRYHNE